MDKSFNFWSKKEPIATNGKVNRFFYRCPVCLVVVCIDERPIQLECDTCRDEHGAAHMEFMGQVEKDNLVREYDRPVCDDRCTSARGPTCVCKCGGVNHGSHLWVTIKKFGPIPSVSAPKEAGRYRAQAEDFDKACRSALDAVKARVGVDAWNAFNGRGWINNRELWLSIHYAVKTVNKARKMRDHKSRMKTLAKVIAVETMALSF